LGRIPAGSVDWLYICGTQIECDSDVDVVESDSVEFVGLPPGIYRAFLAPNSDAPYHVIAASDPFEIEGMLLLSGDSLLGGAITTSATIAVSELAENKKENKPGSPPTIATVSTEKFDYSSADADEFGFVVVRVSFQNAAGKYDDWIGIYPADTEDSLGRIPAGSVDWLYICGTQIECDSDVDVVESDSVEFVGLPPGIYRAFLAPNSDAPYHVIAASDPFEIEGMLLPSGDSPLGGALNWTDDWNGNQTGDWELGENDTPLGPLSTDRRNYNAASDYDIIVTFDNPEAGADDWIGIYPLGSELVATFGDEEFLYLPSGSADWVYTCGSQQCSRIVSSGTVTFMNGLDPGIFQAYLAPNTSAPYRIIAASEPFEVSLGTSNDIVPSSADPSVPESQVQPGAPFKGNTDKGTASSTRTFPDRSTWYLQRKVFIVATVIVGLISSVCFCCKYGSASANGRGSEYGVVTSHVEIATVA